MGASENSNTLFSRTPMADSGWTGNRTKISICSKVMLIPGPRQDSGGAECRIPKLKKKTNFLFFQKNKI